MKNIESAMTMRDGEKAFFHCLACGYRESVATFSKAEEASEVHLKVTGHTMSVVMAKSGTSKRKSKKTPLAAKTHSSSRTRRP